MEIATILSFLGAGCAGLLMLAVALRARRSVPRWLFTAGLGASALERLFSGLSLNSASADGKAYWETWRLLALSCLPGVWSYFSMIYARGPSRELPARRKALLLILSVSPILFALVYRERMLAYIGQLGVDFPWMFGLTRSGTSLYILVLIGAVVVLMNLERTYRASVGTMRWRIKFMILGLAVLFVARAYTSAQALIFHAINLRLDVVDSAALLLACLLILRTLSRTGHFEVTVYPSQAVLRSSVTMLLAGVYLVVVGALAKVISYLPGKASFEAKAFLALVALVVLAILLMSDRLRLRTRTFVSRHFSRPLHDYPQVWRTFAAGTARCLEPSALCEGIVKAISDIFQALSVTIWLLDESKEKLTFMASTSLFKTEATGTGLEAEETTQLITALREQHEPMDIDRSTEPWAAALRSLHPDQFRRGGHRVCVPVAAGGDLLGIIMVGDRVGGALYEVQDLELLKAVAEQAGAGLLNLQLAEKLSEAKQLEAFRAMAAFFVHDLKNTTSTLTLMLKNLPVHFKDPVFREEALVDIARTAKQLEELISRLNLLRQELKVASVECDLNQLVTDALKGQELAPGIVLVKELRPVPKLLLDPLQIQTVITNLILNARDAVGNSGRILVETRSSDSRVTLAVSDNGCGMAPEFIHEHLFRPFQTTKRNGIGIGMFHCKMIVDAHRGRIDVESRKGSGTTFRVSFPCRSESSHSFLDLRSEPAITRSGAAAQKRLQLDCRRAESPALGLV